MTFIPLDFLGNTARPAAWAIYPEALAWNADKLLAADFYSRRYRQGAHFAADPTGLPALVHARSGTRAETASSAMYAFADNVPAVVRGRGLLVRAAIANRVPYPHDLANAAWSLSNCGRTGGQADMLGGTSAVRLTDSSITQAGLLFDSFAVPADTSTRTAAFLIRKEAAPTAEAGINLVYSGGTPQTLTLRFNALTGVVTFPTAGCFVTDLGEWWRVMYPHQQYGTNTTLSFRPIPAAREIGELVINVASQGSATFDFAELVDGTVVDGALAYTPAAAPVSGADTVTVDLAGLTTGFSEYAIGLVAVAVVGDGLTLHDMADASDDGFRVYRSGFALWGAARTAGVEGSPQVLATAPPGTQYAVPLNVRIAVDTAGDVVASCNGNPDVTFAGAGRAFTTAWLGHRADGSGQWDGEIRSYLVDEEAASIEFEQWTLFDDYQRADSSSLGAAVTGQAPVFVPGLPGASPVSSPNSQIPQIVAGRMVAFDETTPGCATYPTYPLGGPGRVFLAAVSFSAGTDSYGAVGLILSGPPNGTDNTHITRKSLHISFSNKFVVLGVFNGGPLEEVAIYTWNVALATDEKVLLGYSVAGTTVTLYTPGGTFPFEVPQLEDFSEADLSHATPEIFWADSNPTPRKPRFDAIWVAV